MLHVTRIENIDDPALEPYRTMKQQQDHHDRRIFVAEGEKVVRRLLESGLPILSLLMPPKWYEDMRGMIERRPEDIRVFLAEKCELEKLTGFSMYQGVLGLAPIPPAVRLELAIRRAASPRLFAAVDGLSNAENMGGLIRNCAAFGVQALVVGETCANPYLRRAVRSSMGTVFKLPVVEPSSLAEALRELRRQGIRCVAAHPHTDQRFLPDADLAGDCCVVFGSEGLGLRPEILEACDDQVAIPMHNGVDSLNVGSCAAVFLYEVQHQRSSKL
jgi:tRNA G18 (ribose-2'-O)-methylase SpoU